MIGDHLYFTALDPNRPKVKNPLDQVLDARGAVALYRIHKANGVAVAIASGFKTVRGLAGDDEALYLSDFGANAIVRVPKSGAPVRVASGQQAIALIAHGDHLYWLNKGDDFTIRRMPKLGGTIENLAILNSKASTFTVWGEYVYYETQYQIGRVPLRGGALDSIATLAGTQALNMGAFCLEASGCYFATGEGLFAARENGADAKKISDGAASARRIVSDERYLFAVTSNDMGGRPAVIWRIPKTGGTAEALVKRPMKMSHLFIDAERLYWIDEDSRFESAIFGGERLLGAIRSIAKMAPAVPT